MSTRLDEVLAAGLARMSVAPVPTGVRWHFNKEALQSISNAAKEILQREDQMNDKQLSWAMQDAASRIREEHNIPDDKQKEVYEMVRKYRKSSGGRTIRSHSGVERFPKETYSKINELVEDLVARQESLSDAEVREEMSMIVQAVMRHHNLPASRWGNVKEAVNAARRRVPGHRTLAQQSGRAAQSVDMPAPPQDALREMSSLQEQLDATERELEALLGEKAMPMPRHIYLEPYGRMLVAKYFKDPERKGALAELASNLELSEKDAMTVVESEEKRITKAAFLNHNAKKKWPKEVYDQVTDYVNTTEQLASDPRSHASLRALRLKIASDLQLTREELEMHIATEQKRRRTARGERDSAIDLQARAIPGSGDGASSSSDAGGSRWRTSVRMMTLGKRMRNAASWPEFQAVLAYEAREPRFAEELKRSEDDEFVRDLLDTPGGENNAWIPDVLDLWNPKDDYLALLADEEGALDNPDDYDALLADEEGALDNPLA